MPGTENFTNEKIHDRLFHEAEQRRRELASEVGYYYLFILKLNFIYL